MTILPQGAQCRQDFLLKNTKKKVNYGVDVMSGTVSTTVSYPGRNGTYPYPARLRGT